MREFEVTLNAVSRKTFKLRADSKEEAILLAEAILENTGISAEYGDSLLTLSTCEYSRNNGRMVVVAKRIAPSPGEVNTDAGD